MSHNIQSILFDKNYYTVQEAKRWIQHHNFKIAKEPDITPHLIRIRQHDPNESKYHYVIKKIPNHIEFVLEYPKK